MKIIIKSLKHNSLFLLFKKAPETIIYALTYVSLTYFFILLNMLGMHELSLQISLLQSIVAFITIGLSGDLRSIYLSNKKYYLIVNRARFFLFVAALIALFIAKFYYFSNIFNFPIILFIGLIVRRLFDWFDEILIATNAERKEDGQFFIAHYFLVQGIFIFSLPFFYKFYAIYIFPYIFSWLFLTIYLARKLYIKFYLDNLKNFSFLKKKESSNVDHSKQLAYQIFSTLMINANNLVLRYLITLSFPIRTAAMIISSYSIGGFLFSIISNVFLPNVISKFLINKIHRHFKKNIILYFLLIFANYVAFQKYSPEYINVSWLVISSSFVGGGVLLLSNYIRLYIIQIKNNSTLFEDFIIHASFLIIICYIYFTHKIDYFMYAINILSFLSLFIFYNAYKLSSSKLNLNLSYISYISLLKLTSFSLIIYCFYKL